MLERIYADFAWEQTAELLAIDSPTGYTRRAAEWVKEAFEKLGFPAHITTKGGVIADLGGADAEDGLLLEAHADTLGGMLINLLQRIPEEGECPSVTIENWILQIVKIEDRHIEQVQATPILPDEEEEKDE